MHIHWDKTLDAPENQHLSSLIWGYWPDYWINILVIFDAIFETEAFKFSAVGSLNDWHVFNFSSYVLCFSSYVD